MQRLAMFVLSLLIPAVLHAAAPADPTPSEVAQITAAAPSQPRVKPQKPRKLLVFSISWGYVHDSIPYGKKALEILARKTGAFEAVISDDPTLFEADNLKQFDAIFFNNTNNEIFLPENFAQLPADQQAQAVARDQRLKANLVEYLRSGHGLAVIHAGVASFRQWPEFGTIIGARFTNHPWGSGSTVTLKVDEPTHPLAQAFQHTSFPIRD
ncbi:MAG TPA: ThuA domain-containing protein, partial [Tepidisphaeraceae bacterium]|nr:ThuA domain-containing protein [Tepidisphaeraceae bacterium]